MAQGLAPRGGGPVAGAVSGRGLRRPKPRTFQADTAPRAGPFNLKFLKPLKGVQSQLSEALKRAVSRYPGCGPAALTSTMSTTKKGGEGHAGR